MANCTTDPSALCQTSIALLNATRTMTDSIMKEGHYSALLRSTRFWVQRVLVPAVMTIGIVGNVITIVIMTRRRMRSSTNNYLAALAIFDMMYLVFTFVLSLSHYPNMSDEEHYIYWKIKPFMYMLTDTCSNSSVWLTVTFTVERYIAVCHPIRGKVYCTESRAKKAIIIVFLFCFAFTLPTPFEWVVEEKYKPELNKTVLFLNYSDLGSNSLYKTIYYWLTVAFFIFIPFLLLAVFNSFLIRSVHISKVKRSAMTRLDSREENSQENKITIMLIAVVILFLVCQLPTACHLLYNSLHEVIDQDQQELMSSLGNIFNLLMAVNAAGNFVLYSLLSQKYRRTFVQIFCPCLMQRLLQANSMCYQSTICTNVDTDSPCGSSPGRRYSNARISRGSSPRSSNLDVSHTGSKSSPALSKGSPRTAFLKVPNASPSKSVYDDDEDLDSDNNTNTGSPKDCSPCKKALGDPWRKFKRSVATPKKQDPKEQVITMKNTSNKCIVITAPEMMEVDSHSNSYSIV